MIKAKGPSEVLRSGFKKQQATFFHRHTLGKPQGPQIPILSNMWHRVSKPDYGTPLGATHDGAQFY